jgi:hypothetical protein
LKCPACHTRNLKQSRFCKKCGQDLSDRDASASDGQACLYCEALNPKTGKFCKKCGKPLTAESPPEPSPKFVPRKSPPKKTPKPEPAAVKPSPSETQAPTETPVLASEPASDSAKDIRKELVHRLKQAKTNPMALLAPANKRFSYLELAGVVLVLGLFVLLYFAGMWRWGPQVMLTSGAPAFLAYLFGLTAALRTFRSLLDKPLMGVFRWLGRFAPKTRIVVGLAFPLLYAFWASEDRNMGFVSAGWTMAIAVLASHVIIRSTAFRKLPT